MLSRQTLDLVVIAVPTSLHRDVGLAVIESGADVLIEKPIASTCLEALELINAAKTRSRRIAVGHIERFIRLS